MRSMNRLSRFWDAVKFVTVILMLPAVYPAHETSRFQVSASALWLPGIINAEPVSGPQPPCGDESIPAYPRLDDPAVVKSWSESELGHDWRPPACSGWTEVGFTTLVTIVARFRPVKGAESLLQGREAVKRRCLVAPCRTRAAPAKARKIAF